MRSKTVDGRGQSRAIPVVMMAAIAVVLASVVSGQFIGMSAMLQSEAPTLARVTATLEPHPDERQSVEIIHVSGDQVTVSDLEVVVDAEQACGRRGRLVRLPTDAIGPANVEGDDIFSEAVGTGELRTGGDGTWSAGETLAFGIDGGRCQIEQGETVTVRLVHTPSGTVIFGEELTAS